MPDTADKISLNIYLEGLLGLTMECMTGDLSRDKFVEESKTIIELIEERKPDLNPNPVHHD
jgi:hypothetical protein